MQDPIYTRITSIPRPSLFAVSGLIALASVGLWVTEFILSRLPANLSDGMALENLLYYLPFVVLPVLAYMLRHPGLSEAMRLNPLPLMPALSVSLLAVLSVYVASILSALWGLWLDALGLTPLDGLATPDAKSTLAIFIVTLGAMPAVAEELLFRGFALAGWESRGTWFAIGVTSGLFALLHGNLYGFPAYLLVGAISGFVTFALNSVYAGMVYHTVYNTACLIIPWVAANHPEAEEAAAVSPTAASLALETLMILTLMAMLLASLALRARREDIRAIPRIHRPLKPRDRGMLALAVGIMIASTAVILALSFQLTK